MFTWDTGFGSTTKEHMLSKSEWTVQIACFWQMIVFHCSFYIDPYSLSHRMGPSAAQFTLDQQTTQRLQRREANAMHPPFWDMFYP